jgi:hypothetical protein
VVRDDLGGSWVRLLLQHTVECVGEPFGTVTPVSGANDMLFHYFDRIMSRLTEHHASPERALFSCASLVPRTVRVSV